MRIAHLREPPAGGPSMKIALLVMTFIQGLGAGICFDTAAVKLPAFAALLRALT